MALEKITGIVTDILKYSDRHNVVTLFTRSKGRVPLIAPAGNGKSARMRNAMLMPLSLISADVNFNATREMQYLGKFQREKLWKDIYFNPVKSAVSLFIAEFLDNYIRNSGPDERLWDFSARAVEILDKSPENIANFHLAFLIEFSSYAGIRPDIGGWREDAWFDMRGGAMTIFPPAHRDYLAAADVPFMPQIMRMNLRNFSHFKMNAAQRRELLKTVLRYFSIHFPGMSSLKSPDVLAEIFG